MSSFKVSSDLVWDIPFFSDFNDNEKADLLAVSSFRQYKRGEMLFLQGDPLTHIYWICSGSVQTFRETPDGHEITIAIRTKNDVLYDPDVRRLKQNHTKNARAVLDTMLLSIPANWIYDHLTSGKLANKFFTLMTQRAQEAQIEVEHQSTMSSTQLIACFLQHLCLSHHFDPMGFDLPYSKSLIASRLGMELESLSRALPKLKAVGISINGKHVVFDDIEAVQNHVCEVCSVIDECPAHQAMQLIFKSSSLPKAS